MPEEALSLREAINAYWLGEYHCKAAFGAPEVAEALKKLKKSLWHEHQVAIPTNERLDRLQVLAGPETKASLEELMVLIDP